MKHISFLFVLLALPALAQVDRATITGTLRDPSGAVVTNAKVTITYPATGLHREVTANGSGVFLFPGLPVGHVTLDAVPSGFRPIRVELDRPATAKLLENVLHDQAIAASTAKDYFHRKFPVTAEMPASYREWTCDTPDRKPDSRPLRSYPSGHATLGYSVGVVLAELIPEKSQAILIRAADYAYSREVCGDHYHSDVEASRALGTALGMMLLENAALKPQIDAAKAELRAAHLTQLIRANRPEPGHPVVENRELP
jgi:membrane-associated phospholipid phosphatase